MKNLKKISLLVFSLFAFSIYAQSPELINELNQEQILLLEESITTIKSNRDSFKSNFTSEQKAILKDKSISRIDRWIKLETTFTEAQKAQYQENKERAKASRVAFRKSLTLEQKAKLKTYRSKMKSLTKAEIKKIKKQIPELIQQRKAALGM